MFLTFLALPRQQILSLFLSEYLLINAFQDNTKYFLLCIFGLAEIAGFYCHAAKKVNPENIESKTSRILQVVENY